MTLKVFIIAPLLRVATYWLVGLPVNEHLLGDWPDPLGYFTELAENHDLTNVEINVPDIFEKAGNVIHPSEYGHHYGPGTIVAAQV